MRRVIMSLLMAFAVLLQLIPALAADPASGDTSANSPVSVDVGEIITFLDRKHLAVKNGETQDKQLLTTGRKYIIIC